MYPSKNDTAVSFSLAEQPFQTRYVIGSNPIAAARKSNLRKGDPFHVYETEIAFQKGKQNLKIAGIRKSPQKVRLLLWRKR